MSKPRSVVAALTCGLALLAAIGPGCGTDAQAIDACRQIEEARCRQAVFCPDQFAIRSSDDVSGCVSFYRDQCLHGLQVPDPGAPAVKACVDAIGNAGTCAQRDAKALLSSCNPAVSSGAYLASTTATSACEALQFPERVGECSFLVPPVPAVADSGAADGGADAAGDAPAE